MSKHSLSSKTLAANEALKTKFYRSSFQWLYRDIPYFSHLWSAALEQLAMKELGITTGFCVSGKDRRAIVLMLTDALDIFYTQYDRLPKFLTEGQNQDYDELADLFAHIYCTYHHQHNSAYNAPGVFALKNAYMYLPTKFKANITQIMVKEDALTCDDELASINDIAKLYDRHYVVSDHLACRQWQALNLLKFAVENWFTVPNRPVNVHNDLVSKINRVLQSASNAYWFRFYDELVDNDQTNTDSLLPGQYPCLWQLVKLLHGAVQSESDQFRDEKIAIDNLANTFRQNYIADSDASNDMTPKPNLSELYLTIKSIIEERSLWCEAQPFFLRFFSGRQADIKNNNVAKPIKVLQQTIAQLESPVAYQGGVSLFNDQFKLLLLKKLGKELKQKQMWLDNNCLYLFCSGLAHIDVNNVQASLHFFQSFLYDHQPFEDSNRLDAGLNNECSL
jgi:hypothetical protein